MSGLTPIQLLSQEAKALLSRLDRVKPFALQQPAVSAAQISPEASISIENFMAGGQRRLRQVVLMFLQWLSGPGARASPVEAQRRYAIVRLKFIALLTQFDVFADVLSQRSEYETGVWLSGLDAAAADILNLDDVYEAPAVVCYLDRGAGAAIRRARTRLPGGGDNPVAVVRIPRERMIGSGIASSLAHEVGHQAAALMGLVPSLTRALRVRRSRGGPAAAWSYWQRWISEIIADFWSVARVGVGSTRGLMEVVSLPRAFVFRVNLNDPHPTPWIRVLISAQMGKQLYPHPQWDRLATLWKTLYPLDALPQEKQRLLTTLEAAVPELTQELLTHRPKALKGRMLREVMDCPPRQPARLSAIFRQWSQAPETMPRASPSLALAVLGQTKCDGGLSAPMEHQMLNRLLTQWALQASLGPPDTAASPAAAA